MHEFRMVEKTWLRNYKVKRVYFNDKLFKKTSAYIKKQINLNYSKVYFLLNIFINKKYPACNILIYKNQIVGFVGTIYSKKKYSKKSNINCNIHSWMVDKNHRIASSLLLSQIKKNCIITVLSSLPRLEKTFLKLRFKKLFMKYNLTLLKKFKIKQSKTNFKILNKFNDIKNKINQNQKKIFNDYNFSRFKRFLIWNTFSNQYCFIVGDIILKKKFLKTMNIVYCSNPKFFKKNFNHFIPLINNQFKVTLLGEFFLNKSESLFTNRMFSTIIKKTIYIKGVPKKFKFDILYSETEF